MARKTFLTSIFAVPLVAGVALVAAPGGSEASTLTGSVELNIVGATVSGTLDGDNNLVRLDIAGDFTTLNTLSCYTTCTNSWIVGGTVDYGPSSTAVSGTSILSETGGGGLNWNQVRTSPATATSLFSFISFFDNMVSTALGSGGAATGTRNIGTSSVDWSVTGAQIEPPFIFEERIATSGSFEMRVNPSLDIDGLNGFLSVFGGFPGIPEDIAGITAGPQPIEAAFTVTPQSAPGVIPLPASLPLLAGGLGVFGLAAWRRRSRPAA